MYTPGTGPLDGTVTPAKLAGSPSPANGQSVVWNGSAWVSANKVTDPNPAGPDGDILVRSGGTWAALAVGSTSDELVVRSDGTVKWTKAPVVNVLAWGAVADAVKTTGSITAGSNQLTLSSGSFTNGDVGKVVLVGGAGATVNLGASNGGTAVPRPFRAWIGSVSGAVASLFTTKGGSTPANATTSQSGTSVTYGTNLFDAVDPALATGRPVKVPGGDWVFAGTTTNEVKRLFGDGHASRIYVSNDFAQFAPTPGTGLTGSTMALGSNAATGDLTLTLASAPSTIASGDILFLGSTAVWEPAGTDADATATTKGEFVRVQQVQGSTVYLESPIADNYTTATTAQVQAFSFADGFDASRMRFVSATPNVINYTASTPFSLSQYAGDGVLFELIRRRNIKASDLEFEGLGASHLHLLNCIDFDVARPKTLDSSRLGAYGYTVSLFASQWGEVTNGRSRRSSSLFNAQGVLASASGQATMPTRWVEVRDCVSHQGQHEPFLTHITAEFVDFIDCRAYGGAFYNTETGHSPGFRIFGRNCKLIDPIAENIAGTAIFIAGKNCEIHNPVIRSVRPNYVSSRAIDLYGSNPGATGTIIRNADIDGVKLDGSNAEGHGIVVQNGATARIVGRNEVRNVQGYGVWDGDLSGATKINGLTGVNHGSSSAAATPYLVKCDQVTPTARYRDLRVESWGAGVTARVTDKQAAVDNRYTKITADGTFVVPDGVSKVRARLVGAGGGGGGAGSAAATQLQAGGGGAAAGSIVELEIDVSPGETLNIDVGTGGAGGAGGAAGGNAGSQGSVGGSTTLTNQGASTLGVAPGGAAGRNSAASNTTAGSAGLWGSIGNAGTTPTAGTGGTVAGGASSGPPMLVVVGGGGGGAATATNGGGGGAVQLVAGNLQAQSNGASGASGTSAGVTPAAATMPGCGGGGGGGGAAGTGAGGTGGAGADGLVELWW